MSVKLLSFTITIILSQASFVYGSNCLADFYVSPVGNDFWSGTLPAPNPAGNDGPFRSITKARDAVRCRLASMNKNIVVMFREGEYFLDSTVVFGLEDSGKGKYKVIYRNYPQENPVFTSGLKITGWKKVEQNSAGLSERAKNKVWVALMPRNLAKFYTLYDKNFGLLPRARGEGFRAAEKVKHTGPDHYSLKFPEGKLKKLPEYHDIDILIRPTVAWTMNILPLEKVDEQKCIATTSVPATYQMGYVWCGCGADKNVWVENSFDVLDDEGEWVYNSHSGKLYLWPHGDKPGDEIYAPKLTEFVRIEGNIDYEGPADRPVKNIVFEGLTFTRGNYYRKTKKHVGCGLQHDWEFFDAPSAMLRLRGVEDCAINSCKFINSDSTAIRLDLHCQGNQIANNYINNIGGCGIVLAGYGPGTKDVNTKNTITNNHIQKVGRVYWHCPAIFIWQSDKNLVANNLIHDTPYTGIVVSGRIVWDKKGIGECSKTIRWHEIDKIIKSSTERPDWYKREAFLHSRRNVVKNNEIHSVMQVLGDGNAIYVSGGGGGNLVHHNLIYNIADDCQSVIRTDDDQYETTISDNIIWNCRCPAFTLKHKNYFINNIMVNCGSNDLANRSRYYSYIVMRLGPVNGSKIMRNIFYSTTTDAFAYEYGRTYGKPTHIKDCLVDYNLYFSPNSLNWEKDNLLKHKSLGIEAHSIIADPLFVDVLKGDFRVKSDSPVLKLGFNQIDTSNIGLIKDN